MSVVERYMPAGQLPGYAASSGHGEQLLAPVLENVANGHCVQESFVVLPRVLLAVPAGQYGHEAWPACA
jgi:hypothetical protein